MKEKMLRILWLPILVVGVGLTFGGVFAVVEGNNARDDVVAGLVAENIKTSEDASIPNSPVVDAATARAQADVIRQHVEERAGGSYAELKKDDPNRETAFKGAALRTGLMLSVLAFGVVDLVVGLGWAFLGLGLVTIIVGVPASYLLVRRN